MPVFAPGPCWTRFVEFNTTIRGTTILLAGMAEVNVEDCRHNPALLADLNKRCRAALAGIRRGSYGELPGTARPGRPGVPPFRYQEEPIDRWQAFSVLAENAPEQTIVADCDCLSPMWAAFFFLAGIQRVGVGISQPRTRACASGTTGKTCGYGMAHAYTVIGLDRLPMWLVDLLVPLRGHADVGVFDGSVFGGMPPPREGFYGSGESDLRWLHKD